MKTINKTHYYLYTFCRYFSATMILIYAFAKIIGTQFESSPITYDTPIGELNGMDLAWFYFGYSYPFAVFIALSQITSSVLLLFRKTVRLGSILFLCIMVNIIAVDIAFKVDFDALIMAIILLIMGLFLFFSEFKSYIKYFINEPSLFHKENMPNWVLKIYKLKFIYIAVVFIGLFILLLKVKNTELKQNEFYGSWQLVKGDAEYNKLYFDGTIFQTVEIGKTEIDRKGKYKFDFKTKKIVFTSYPPKYLKEMSIKIKNGILLDSTKREKLFEGIYELKGNSLKLKNENIELVYRRKR